MQNTRLRYCELSIRIARLSVVSVKSARWILIAFRPKQTFQDTPLGRVTARLHLPIIWKQLSVPSRYEACSSVFHFRGVDFGVSDATKR